MMTWNEILDNLKGDVQDKSKNPFFGAFIATWVIRHWEVVFILFNFDEEFHLDAKLYRVNCYFDSLPKGDFWWTIVYTFGVILLGYVVLNLARIISNLSEKIVTPYIYKWTAGKASIVLKEVYERSLEREEDLRRKIESLNGENLKLRDELKSQGNMITALNKQIDERINKEVEKEMEKNQNQKPEEPKIKNKKTSPDSLIGAPIEPENLKPFAKATVNRLTSSEREMLYEVIEKIKVKDVIPIDYHSVVGLIKNSIIKQTSKDINGFAYFKLTELGEEIKKILNL